MNAVATMRRDDMEVRRSDSFVWAARHASPSGSPFVADTSTELLRTIAGVLDIREVFRRVSDIVQEVVPHDALALRFCDHAGDLTLEARSTDDLPAHGWSCTSRTADRDFSIVSDLRQPHSGAAREAGVVEALVLAGYRSALSVRAVAQHQVMLLGFFSKHTNTYTMDDRPAARHIADYVAVAVAHEQLAAA